MSFPPLLVAARLTCTRRFAKQQFRLLASMLESVCWRSGLQYFDFLFRGWLICIATYKFDSKPPLQLRDLSGFHFALSAHVVFAALSIWRRPTCTELSHLAELDYSNRHLMTTNPEKNIHRRPRRRQATPARVESGRGKGPSRYLVLVV
jgi:hypothetical protein